MLPDVIPVILAGGEGLRLRPLTSPDRPKPLLKLRGRSLLQMTATRLPEAQAPVVIASRRHADRIHSHMDDCAVAPQQVFLEPEGRGTAPAVAAVAHYFQGSNVDPLLLVMPSDHMIKRPDVFRDVVYAGATKARGGDIVMFGVTPHRPATGFGYIKHDGGAVAQFVEKPARPIAQQFLKEKIWLWNSGIFLFRASTFLGRLQMLDPILYDSSRTAVTRAARRQNAVLLDEAAFKSCTAISIDRAVMEKDGARTVIPVDMGWRDLGTRRSFIAGLMGI